MGIIFKDIGAGKKELHGDLLERWSTWRTQMETGIIIIVGRFDIEV